MDYHRKILGIIIIENISGRDKMKDLTKGEPGKLILQFALPIFVGNLFQLFYSLVDTRIIGRVLGTEALAAVGATSTLNNLIIGFLVGLTNGFALLTARSFGAKDEEEVKKNIAGTLMLGIVIALLLTGISVTMLPWLLACLHLPEELMQQGMSYIRIILAGMITAMLYNICASTLRAMGDTVAPLVFLVVATLCNIGLDYLFILPFNMGVAGAALATVCAQLLSALLCFIYIRKRYSHLRLSRVHFKIEGERIKGLLCSGMAMGMMQSLVALGTLALQGTINTFGTTIIVAHTAARKLTELFMMPFSALGMTMATYCGQNDGAGRIDRVREGIKKAIGLSIIWCLIVSASSIWAVPFLIRQVTATTLQEVIDTATLYLRVDTSLYMVTALIAILRNALQGIGDRWIPILSSLIELIGKVLVVIFLTPRLHYMGIILAEPIVWVVMVIPLIFRMRQRLHEKR